jgi:hypothetical protein
MVSDPLPPPVRQLALPLDDPALLLPPPLTERLLCPANVWATLSETTRTRIRARWLHILQEVIDHADEQ